MTEAMCKPYQQLQRKHKNTIAALETWCSRIVAKYKRRVTDGAYKCPAVVKRPAVHLNEAKYGAGMVLTNYGYPEYERHCLQSGANEFCAKSSEYDEFLKSLRRLN